MATDLGKVGMRMRGDWNSSTAYEVLDAVSYNLGLYVAKQAVPANTAPTNTTYWQEALSPTSIINSLGRYTDITDSLTPTNCTIGGCKVARLGAFIAMILVVTVTGNAPVVTGVPAAGVNLTYGIAYNNTRYMKHDFNINISGVLNIGTNDSNIGDSIRICWVYPAADQ